MAGSFPQRIRGTDSSRVVAINQVPTVVRIRTISRKLFCIREHSRQPLGQRVSAVKTQRKAMRDFPCLRGTQSAPTETANCYFNVNRRLYSAATPLKKVSCVKFGPT